MNDVLENDWAAFFRERIYEAGAEPPLDGLTRGGYRLVFAEGRSEFQREAESYGRNADFSYSLGLIFGENGNVTGVQWDGPAFNQGVTVGTQVVAVNGVSYSNESLRRAVTTAKGERVAIELLLRNGDQYRTIALDYHDGLRYPQLERDGTASDRLTEILSPRSQ